MNKIIVGQVTQLENVEDKMDFHIDTNFYKDLIEQARKTLQKVASERR